VSRLGFLTSFLRLAPLPYGRVVLLRARSAAAGEFLKEFGGSPEAEEAKALLAQVKGQYAEQVEATLMVAIEAAERSLAAGNYAEASKAFTYVRMRLRL
jgi:hypothetical protein